jgi:hypothetical protein
MLIALALFAVGKRKHIDRLVKAPQGIGTETF